MWRRAPKQSVSSSSSPVRPFGRQQCCPFLARKWHAANATRYLPRRLLTGGKVQQFRDPSWPRRRRKLGGWSPHKAMLYCYNMTHHHHAGGAHPSPALSPSLLRLSVPKRLALAGGLIALIWVAVLWAIR